MGWQDDFQLKPDLVQRDIMAFEEALARHTGGLPKFLMALTGTVTAISAAAYLKAAIDAGWLLSAHDKGESKERGAFYTLAGDDLEDAHAGKVRWYGNVVIQAYNKAVDIPPNS